MWSYFKLILQTGSVKIYVLFAGLISLWLTFKILGPEARGILIVTLTWVRLASGIAHLSFGQTILHHASEIKDNSWLPTTLGSALSVCVGMTIIVWLILVGLSLYNHDVIFGKNIPQWFFFTTLLIVPFLIWDFYGLSLLSGIDRLQVSNKAGFISQTISLALLPLMFVFNILGAFLASLFGRVINSFYVIRSLIKELPEKVTFQKRHTKKLLMNALKLHPAVLCGILVTYSDILMVSHFLGTTQAGFYQMGAQLVLAMLMLPQTATMVLFTLTSKKGVLDSWPECRNIIMVISGIMIVASIFAWFLAPLILPVIFGPESQPMIAVFMGLQFAVLGQSWASLVSTQWIANGYFKTVSVISVIMTFGNLALNYYLIPIYGLNGAIIATCSVYLASLFINGGMIITMERRWKNKAKA